MKNTTELIRIAFNSHLQALRYRQKITIHPVKLCVDNIKLLYEQLNDCKLKSFVITDLVEEIKRIFINFTQQIDHTLMNTDSQKNQAVELFLEQVKELVLNTFDEEQNESIALNS